jgi:hypothetical protein
VYVSFILIKKTLLAQVEIQILEAVWLLSEFSHI